MSRIAVAGTVVLLAVAGALAWQALSGGEEEETLRVEIPTLPGETHLRMEDSPPSRRWQYRLEVESRVRRPVTLEARLAEPAPAGVRVALADPLVSREATAHPTLIVVAPSEVGPFEGRVVLSSADLPGWKKEYTFEGDVTERGLEGRFLRARPRGVDLGELTPGERTTFAVALESFGSEEVTVRDVVPDDPERIRLPRDLVPARVRPGGELQIQGLYVAPRAGGEQRHWIRVFSDARNYPRSLDIVVRGRVVPDYAAEPARLGGESEHEYPVLQPRFKVTLRAREGIEPFRVAAVEGHERLFELVSKGSDDPAREQVVELEMRRDAPTHPREPFSGTIFFHLQPGDKQVAVPFEMRLHAPIEAFPAALAWGGDDLAPRTITVSAVTGRQFEVTRAYAEEGRFAVHYDVRQGMTPEILVAIPKGVRPGLISDRIVIETDDPDVPKLIVPAKANVK